MKEIFEYILVQYFDQNFTIANLILVSLVIILVLFFRKFASKRVERLLLKKEWKFGKGKDKIVHILLSQTVIIIGILLLISALGYGNKDFSLSSILEFHLLEVGKFKISLGQLLGVVILIFATRMIINLSKVIVFKVTAGKDWIDEGRQFTIIQLTKYVVYVISTMLIIRSLGFGVSSLLIAGSTLLIGLGLGLQEMFTDVVSGFILLFDGNVKVGDIVEIGDVIAKVKKINIRTSHVKTMDGKIIVLPNSKLTEDNVVNWTISDKVTRFHISVGVAYGSDTQKVKELLYQCALAHPLVNKKRNIIIMFKNFGDSSLEFELYFWAVRTWEIMVIKSDLRFAIDKSFRENDIRIPFPQRDLHIVSDVRMEDAETE